MVTLLTVKYKHIIVIRLVVGKDLDPFVVVVTNIDTTIRTKSYTNRTAKLTTSRSLRPKAMNEVTNMVKDRHTMITITN